MKQFAVTNVVIFTVNERNQVIENGTVIVDGDRISAIFPAVDVQLQNQLSARMPVLNAQGKKVLLPGLVDCHSHSSLMRGVNENQQLMDWLPQYQLEHRALTEHDAYHSARLCYLEALKNGTTCVMDMYRYMHRCADAASELGIRVNLAPYAADMPGKDFFATPHENRALIETHHGANQGRIQVWMGLEHLFYCSPEAYQHAVHCSREYGVRIHTHACEQREEEAAVLRHFGKRSIGMLEQYGLLGENTLIAHCVWLNDEEIRLLVNSGTKVAHCPVSNAKLASGLARIPEMQQAGLCIGLGTDGNVCNNNLDLFEEMKFASLMQKATLLDALALPASDLLRMATIGGAQALGLDHDIGSIEVGKKADFILLDLESANLTPYRVTADGGNLLWNLVFSARGSNVSDVWVDGEQLIQDGLVIKVNEREVTMAAQHCALDLMQRCDQLAHLATPVLQEPLLKDSILKENWVG